MEAYFRKENDSLHYIIHESTSSNILSLMIHGANRQYQNAQSFSKNIPAIAEICDILAVSLIGHGKSIPGPEEYIPNNTRTANEQVEILGELLKNKFSNKKYVLIGRSYGARIAMQLARELLSEVIGLVFIAPAGAEYYSENDELHKIPLQLVWIKDDPVISFDKSKIFEKYAKNISKLYLEALKFTEEPWRSHSPQEENPNEVNKAIIDFISKLEN